jgi:hypothetical protein
VGPTCKTRESRRRRRPGVFVSNGNENRVKLSKDKTKGSNEYRGETKGTNVKNPIYTVKPRAKRDTLLLLQFIKIISLATIIIFTLYFV